MSRIFVVCGLGFGDEGKGATVDYLVRKYGIGTVVRFNGGPQAGHNVVSPEGAWHCFAQFGSGTLAGETRTFLSSPMLIEPSALRVEGKHLSAKGVNNAMSRIVIDSDCPVITPYHKMTNQMKELSRKGSRLGSCGMGVGEAVFDSRRGMQLTVSDLSDKKILREKLNDIYRKHSEESFLLSRKGSKRMRETFAYFIDNYPVSALILSYEEFLWKFGQDGIQGGWYLKDLLAQGGDLVFEGAQGALLDFHAGFYPYVTKTEVTFKSADSLLANAGFHGNVTRVGVIRAYATRHGAGPLVTGNDFLAPNLYDPYNGKNVWQGEFRTGWFDLVASRYAIAAGGRPDVLALTCLDKLSRLETIGVCVSYEYTGNNVSSLGEFFEWDRIPGNRIRINSIKTRTGEDEKGNGLLAGLLFDCRPLEFKTFKGWPTDISGATSFDDLPAEAVEYVSYIESKNGLSVPVATVSVGNSALNRLEHI